MVGRAVSIVVSVEVLLEPSQDFVRLVVEHEQHALVQGGAVAACFVFNVVRVQRKLPNTWRASDSHVMAVPWSQYSIPFAEPLITSLYYPDLLEINNCALRFVQNIAEKIENFKTYRNLKITKSVLKYTVVTLSGTIVDAR